MLLDTAALLLRMQITWKNMGMLNEAIFDQQVAAARCIQSKDTGNFNLFCAVCVDVVEQERRRKSAVDG